MSIIGKKLALCINEKLPISPISFKFDFIQVHDSPNLFLIYFRLSYCIHLIYFSLPL